MKILHMSDSHGQLLTPPNREVESYDVIVHSGDLLPNKSFGNRLIEETFQTYWLEENAPKLHPRYWAVPVLITPGNHDYIDVTPILRSVGIDARLLCNGPLTVDGVSFYGHPWTPEFCGWNWMCDPDQMRSELDVPGSIMSKYEDKGIDVFVSHGPMYGVLDRNQDGERCGCKVLREFMQNVDRAPKLLLHGHIHEAAGVQGWSRGMIVSNAARTQRVVSVPADRVGTPFEPISLVDDVRVA